jgi:hypothetical protein
MCDDFGFQQAQRPFRALHLFYEINERRNVIKFVDNFWPQIQMGQKNESLRVEIVASDRFKRAMQKEAARRAATRAD